MRLLSLQLERHSCVRVYALQLSLMPYHMVGLSLAVFLHVDIRKDLLHTHAACAHTHIEQTRMADVIHSHENENCGSVYDGTCTHSYAQTHEIRAHEHM